MRIVSKQRRVSSKRAASHLRWSSDTHTRDKMAADNLRASVMIKPKTERTPFPNAESIAMQCLFEKRPGTKPGEEVVRPVVKGIEFDEELNQIQRERSFYFGKRLTGVHAGKVQRRKAKGILDTYVSIHPWWSKAIAEGIASGSLKPEGVRSSIGNMAFALSSKLGKRTEYQPVYFAVHPDSVNNLHIHFGLATISKDNQLLGRSADGKRGKKGLKHIGDCNLALYRMALVEPSPRNAIAVRQSQKDSWDDVWLSHQMEAELEARFPALKGRAKELALEHVRGWEENYRERKTEVTPTETERLRVENKRLKGEMQKLQSENRELRGEVERVNRELTASLYQGEQGEFGI
jgi:hypothetical protein